MNEKKTDDHIIPVCCQSIHLLDNGAFGNAVNRQIGQIIADINDRPHNAELKPEKRKLKIEIEFEPELRIDAGVAQLEAINMTPSVAGAVPKTVGSAHDVRLREGHPHFNKDIPYAFNQLPLEYGEEDE